MTKTISDDSFAEIKYIQEYVCNVKRVQIIYLLFLNVRYLNKYYFDGIISFFNEKV